MTHTPNYLSPIGTLLFADAHNHTAMRLVSQTQTAMFAVADRLQDDLHNICGQSCDRDVVRMCRDSVKQLKANVSTATFKLRQSLLLLLREAERESAQRAVNNQLRHSMCALSGGPDAVEEADEDCDSTQEIRTKLLELGTSSKFTIQKGKHDENEVEEDSDHQEDEKENGSEDDDQEEDELRSDDSDNETSTRSDEEYEHTTEDDEDDEDEEE